jgi:hypothetical protein
MEAVDWLDVLHEMDHGDDRAVAVVAASFLENNLAMSIMARFRELTEPERKALFGDDRTVLGTFSAKIEIGYALSLFDGDVKRDLDTIRTIRNRFAHHLEVRTFDHPDVRDLCDNLLGPKFLAWAEAKARPEVSKRRQRYLNTASHLTARFDMEAKCHYRPPPPAIRTYETAPKPFKKTGRSRAV